MSFLRDLALAHQKHEGWFPGSRSYRNNNPGNLRAGSPTDEDGFTIYKSYDAGLAALEADLIAKICGQSKWIDYSKNPTFLTYVRVYAPADDGNNPNGYCQVLCRELSAYHVTPSTPLTTLAQLINGQPLAAPVVDPSIRLIQAEHGLRFAHGLRVFELQWLIERLKRLLR